MIINSKEWALVNQEARMNKGKLVNIQISPGRYVKMYEADAIAAGHLKARQPPANKMIAPPDNKDPEKAPEEKPPADEFASIAGVGAATARALVSHGITTFEQLKAAGRLSYLTDKVNDALDAWRANG